MAYAKTNAPKVDVYATITDKIIEAIELGAGKWERPWQKVGFDMPTNVSSKKAYRGINTIMLFMAADLKSYSHSLWGTYKQWNDLGAQVKKGEKSTPVVFWSSFKKEDEESGEEKTGMFAKLYHVFNVDQVDGYSVETTKVEINTEERVAAAEEFFANTRAIIRHGGNRACYSPTGDYVQMPEFAHFKDAVSYYSTLGHEVTHWSGHESRCAREFGKRFGSEAYAFEELVADIGAAFLCNILGLTNEPRPDHAQYIAGWLKVLKSDKKAIFTAASAAQKAVDYLVSFQPVAEALKEAA